VFVVVPRVLLLDGIPFEFTEFPSTINSLWDVFNLDLNKIVKKKES
jgi:hypothetical protein